MTTGGGLNFDLPTMSWWFLAALTLIVAYLLRHIMQTTRASDADEGTTAPPYAPGLRLPLLGHALSYKADPPGFLQRARAEVGPIFTLDLAGLRTTIVSDAPSMRAVATAPERVLSAREAVSDFGFRYTLGDENVMHGTDFHKRILKEGIYGSRDDDAIADELSSFVLDGILVGMNKCCYFLFQPEKSTCFI